jgi:hypothetical protein
MLQRHADLATLVIIAVGMGQSGLILPAIHILRAWSAPSFKAGIPQG